MNRLIPYSAEVYAYVTAEYGGANLPIEICTLLAVAVFLLFGRAGGHTGNRAAAVFLALLWGWIGVGFYWQTYQPLNWAGTYFGWASLVQAALIAIWGIGTGNFRPKLDLRSAGCWIGLVALALAALIGPTMRMFREEAVVPTQAIGVMPLATIAATLALLLINHVRSPSWLLPIPVILLGWEGVRANVMGLGEDMVLVLAGAVVLGLLVFRRLRF